MPRRFTPAGFPWSKTAFPWAEIALMVQHDLITLTHRKQQVL